MICPMKISALVNPNINFGSDANMIDEFLECSTTNCAWYCVYLNGEGECAIHSIHGLFDSLQDIVKEINVK